MTKPLDEMLDHEFDGIREYDNPPPGWIMWILYASVVVAVGYWSVFHVFHWAKLPPQKYQVEVAKAAELQLARMANQEVSDQSLLLMSQIPAQVEAGRQIFDQFCVACHLQDGSGKVGPNLTDNYWIHGGRPLQILNTVTNGVPAKGMVAWKDQLGPARVQKVVAYVLTLKGKNLPGKAPQGVLETDEPTAPAAGPAAGARDSTSAPSPGGT